MRFNGIVITEETDPGQVYENPVHVLSRNKKKAKRILKLFGKVIECKPTNMVMLLQRSAHHIGNYEVFSCSG